MKTCMFEDSSVIAILRYRYPKTRFKNWEMQSGKIRNTESKKDCSLSSSWIRPIVSCWVCCDARGSSRTLATSLLHSGTISTRRAPTSPWESHSILHFSKAVYKLLRLWVHVLRTMEPNQVPNPFESDFPRCRQASLLLEAKIKQTKKSKETYGRRAKSRVIHRNEATNVHPRGYRSMSNTA